MDESFDIELNEESSEVSNVVQLPMNFLTFGEIENDDVKVYIKQDVYKALEKYALEDTEHERGTIILGDYCEEMGKTHVVISNYIEAKYTDASASTLTFTHETWDYVHKEQDAKYPDKKIVGWQHTHPTYGIFLSNYDLFIHENFFNLPFQVAYVIDPVQNLRGFFQWKNGKIEKLKGYYIYDDVGKPIKIAQVKPETKNETNVAKRGINWISILTTTLAIILTIVCLFLISSLRKQFVEQQENQQKLLDVIDQQGQDLKSIQDSLSVEDDNGEIVSLTLTIDELISKLESQQITIDNQQQVIEELKATVEEMKNSSDPEGDEYILYTVKPGDTLGRICASLNIDYWKNRDIILSLNNIANENIVLVGQNLIFPKSIQPPIQD